MIKRKYLILLSLQGLIVALDQLVKFIMSSSLELGQSIAIIPHYFNLTLIHNTGAAFGIMANLNNPLRTPLFLIIPGLTLLAVLFVFTRMSEQQKISIYGLSLIMGGAIGNIVDRIRLGYVVDFLDFHWKNFYHFPAFNVADSAITIGAFLLIISMLFEKDFNRSDVATQTPN